MHVMVSAVSRFTQPSGICRYAANLASCLFQEGGVKRVSLVIGCWQETYFRDLLGDITLDLVTVQIGSSSRERNWWYWQNLPRLAHKLHCDIVHCSFPVPLRRSVFPGLIVTTVHDMYAFDCPENFGFPAVLFNRVFFRQALRASDGVVCDSQETLNRVAYHFPNFPKRKKASVVPCCVDFDRISPRAPVFLSGLVKSPFVLCVAQHRKNKNLDLLITAFAALKSQENVPTGVRLLIVGSSGPETERIKQLADTSLPDGSVIFASGLANDELAWLYQHCELLVIPSSQEGFCFPLAEGIYFGARIVCTDIPILRELGTPECLYFDLSAAPAALAGAMRTGLARAKPEYAGASERYSRTSVSRLQMRFYKELGDKLRKSQTHLQASGGD